MRLVPDTPEILIDLPTLCANIKRAATMARDAGVELRPHIKTHKIPQIAQMQIEAGAVGIQVAKLGEAEVMADAGIDDILIGYPIVGDAKLSRLAALTERASVSVTVDSIEVAEGISRMATSRGITLPTLVEVDTGLRRLGLQPGAASADLAEQVARRDGLEFVGVFTHEGHVYTQARTDEERRTMTHAACQALVLTADEIARRGLNTSVVSVGSSASFRFALEFEGITQARPGTYVFNDRTQVALGSATYDDVAASIVTTVVSRPSPDRAILDIGSKVLTSDLMLVAEPEPTYGGITGHLDWKLIRLSEEHAVLALPEDAALPVGARLRVVANHICPVINLANEVTVVDDGAVVDHWSIKARGLVR